MTLLVAVEGAAFIAPGVVEARLNPEDLRAIAGSPGHTGEVSVVLVNGPPRVEGSRLLLSPGTARVVNIGASERTLFVVLAGAGVPAPELTPSGSDHPVRQEQVQVRVNPEPAEHESMETGDPPAGRRFFWVTVGVRLQDNFRVGIANSVWGVIERYVRRLDPVRPGDYAVFYIPDFGFSLCRIEGRPFVSSN